MARPFESRLTAVLTEIEGRDLLRLAQDRDVSAGTTLYEEGDNVDFVYLLSRGQLALERLTASGDRQILAFVFPGDFIGLDLGGKHISGATTLTDCTVKAIRRTALDALIKDRQALAEALSEQTRRIVAYMLDHICALGRMTARQRLVFFLLHIQERYKQAGLETDPMQFAMTRQDIADFLGIRVETAIRNLSTLAKESLISVEADTRIQLNNTDTLADELP